MGTYIIVSVKVNLNCKSTYCIGPTAPWHCRCEVLWTSCQIRKSAGCACAGNTGNVFPVHRGFAIPTCITTRASRTCRDACRDRLPVVSFEVGGGKNVPGIPGAWATRNFTYLVRGPWTSQLAGISLSVATSHICKLTPCHLVGGQNEHILAIERKNLSCPRFNILRSRQNSHHFSDDIFKWITFRSFNIPLAVLNSATKQTACLLCVITDAI